MLNFHYLQVFVLPWKAFKLLFQRINRKITHSDIYDWGPVVTLKDRKMFSLKATHVAPAVECATFVNGAKNCFVLYHSLLLHTVCPIV